MGTITDEQSRELVENTPDALYLVDPATGEFSYVNAAFVNTLGYTLDDVREMGGRVHFLRNVLHENVPNADEVLSTPEGELDAWWRSQDGSLKYIEHRWRSRYEQGVFTGILGVLHDGTAKRREEEALRHDRLLLRTLIDHIPDPLYVKDTQCRKIVANLADVRNIGLDRESDVLGKDDFDLFPKDIAEKFYADDKTVINTGAPVINREECFHDEEGHQRWLLTTKLPLRDDYGNVIGLVGIGRDITNRRRAEEDLRLFRSLVDHSSDALEVIDPTTGHILDGNERAWTDLGYTKEEFVTLTVADIDPEVDVSAFLRVVTLLSGTVSKTFRSMRRRKDGSSFPVEISTRLVRLQREFVVTTIRDLTERLEVENVLRESERRLQEILQFIPEATMVVDAHGVIVAWNRAMERLSGVSASAMVGKGNNEYSLPFYGQRCGLLLNLLLQEDQNLERRYRNVKRDGDTIQGEVLIPSLLGRKVYLHARATVLRDSKGEVTGMIQTGLDLTMRKEAEEALQASEERFRLISENVADLIVVLDSNSRCLYASPSFREDGWNPVELHETDFLALIHPDDVHKVKAGLEKITADNTHQSLEFRFRRKDKTWRSKETTINLLIYDQEIRVVAVMRDITERMKEEEERVSLQNQLTARNAELEKMLSEVRQMQEGLVQSEKLASIGQLTAGIAHEINNPLAFVSSNLNRFQEYFNEILEAFKRMATLANDVAEDPRYSTKAREMVEANTQADLDFVVEDFKVLMGHTKDGADRIKSIVERLRGFTHLSNEGFTEADINDALEDTINLTWNELKYKATIEREYGEIPKVTCNIGEIKQVLVNLLVNAAHAFNNKGIITLRSYCEGPKVIIQVKDTGEGIQPANLKKIFDPFFTTKPVGKGTGLWISASIVEKHKGRLRVKSELGKGTTMTIELPVEQPSAAQPST